MIAELLSMMFHYNHLVLKRNTEGLTHADSMALPEPGGNNINWILGHILAVRGAAHRLVGDEQPVLTAAETAPYDRGTEPLAAEDARALPLERLLADLDRSQERLTARLGSLTDKQLAAASGEKSTLAKEIGVLQFHEAYHAGQIGLLRRLVGREGAIR